MFFFAYGFVFSFLFFLIFEKLIFITVQKFGNFSTLNLAEFKDT